MADDNELTLKDPAAGKKKKLIMIIALAVIVLGGGGAGAWFMLSGGDKPGSEAAGEGKDAKPKEAVPQPSLYVGMPRPFVFNVSGGQRDRLVQIKIQLMVRGTADETLAKQNIPSLKAPCCGSSVRPPASS